ncbi:MAG TPA: DUF417 family protein [Vicinamibacteria bacterium]|nr:DUF417 family protein [Vicinamibacteria bacterium]
MKLFRHPLVLLACRLVLGAMFLYACHDKILAPTAFAKIVYQWQVGGPVLSNLVAVILPWVEAVVGVLLLAGVWTHEAGLVVAGLLLSFNLAAVSVLARGIDVENCGCTSVKASSGPRSPFHGVGWFLLTRNTLLLAGALALAFAPRREIPGQARSPVASPVATP